MARSPGTDIGGVAGRQLRLRPLPWIKVSLIAAVLCVAVVGWRLYGGNVSSYVETAPVLAARSDNSLEVRELQQQSATYQQQLAEERARGKDLEQQLAARQGDQEALSQERARTKALELQRAARQANQEPLAQERANTKTLEQELVAAR